MKFQRCLKFLVLCPLLGLALLALLGVVVMLLWNAVLPGLLGVGMLKFWPAVGLLLLCKVLFGGWWTGRRWRGGPPWRHRHFDDTHWRALTPEQREEMRAEMRRRFGDWPQCCPWHEHEKLADERPA